MKCNVCGKRFIPKKSEKYLTVEPTTLANSLNGGRTIYDTFDCPRCGCQYRVSDRYDEVELTSKMEKKDE